MNYFNSFKSELSAHEKIFFEKFYSMLQKKETDLIEAKTILNRIEQRRLYKYISAVILLKEKVIDETTIKKEVISIFKN